MMQLFHWKQTSALMGLHQCDLRRISPLSVIHTDVHVFVLGHCYYPILSYLHWTELTIIILRSGLMQFSSVQFSRMRWKEKCGRSFTDRFSVPIPIRLCLRVSTILSEQKITFGMNIRRMVENGLNYTVSQKTTLVLHTITSLHISWFW